MIILPVFILIQCMLQAYAINPCDYKKCRKNEVPCLEVVAKTSTFLCKCARYCKKVNINQYINAPVVGTLSPVIDVISDDGIIISDPAGRPLAKQGGSACYPFACMNGGTCYTNYQIPSTTQPTGSGGCQYQASTPIPSTTTVPTTTTTTSTTTTTTTTTTTSTTTTISSSTDCAYYPSTPAPPTQPICSCQPDFSGSRCELYNPHDGWNNLCRVYNERGMNICQNGGQCVFISDGKVACVCPSTFAGQYCEVPVYTSCANLDNSMQDSVLCHRDYGTCASNGTCVCRAGFYGPSCDQRTPQTPVQTTTPINQICPTNYCNGHGTCVPINFNPYMTCVCDPFYTGTNCEMYLNFNISTTPVVPIVGTTTPLSNSTNSNLPTTTVTMRTAVPRCDFSIGLFNDGAFTTRFKIQYKIDGITQPIITSSSLPFIGQSTFNTIPYYATDITVTIEVLGWNWFTVKEDTGIQTNTYCTKCYKTWGTVTSVATDYVKC